MVGPQFEVEPDPEDPVDEPEDPDEDELPVVVVLLPVELVCPQTEAG